MMAVFLLGADVIDSMMEEEGVAPERFLLKESIGESEIYDMFDIME